MMNRLAGRKKQKAPIPTLEETSNKMGGRSDAIDQKIAKLDRELAQYKKQLKSTSNVSAKRNIKAKAMQVLKRKKMYEQQRNNIGNQQFNIDQQNFALESLKDTATTVQVMKESAKMLKKEYKKVNVDKIMDLQDDLEELMIDADEVNEVMGREYGTPLDLDESELDAELEGLDDEMFFEDETADGEQAAIPDYLKPSEMPTVPTGQIQEETDEYGLPKQKVAQAE